MIRAGLALFVLGGAISCMAQCRPVAASGKPTPQMRVEIDSVDFRPDLTRVYCRAIGRPHTAHRIDAAEIRAIGVKAAAGDIDGVDFSRYFQWEENGVIPLEIDFPPMHESSTVQIGFTTVYGEVETASTPLVNGRATTK